MNYFFPGILVGFLLSAVIGAVWAVRAFRRFEDLQRRTRESERLAELGTLTGGLAHEIKNPLSTVQLNLQLLAEDVTPENPAYSRLANRLKTVQAETARLREILEDFLRYAGRMEIDAKPVELNSTVEELCDFFYPQAQSQHVQLRVKKHSEPVTVNADVKLIKQAVLNLMLNAVQAMHHGGDLILAVGVNDAQATIDIIDTGPGIAADALEKIFQAYYSTKKGGTGLGLALTRRIIREHGGELLVKSEAGKGTNFTILLPRRSG